MDWLSIRKKFGWIAMASVLVLCFQNCGPAKLSTSSSSDSAHTDLGSSTPEDSSPTPVPSPVSPSPSPTPAPTATPTPVPDVVGFLESQAYNNSCLAAVDGFSGTLVEVRSCRSNASQNWVLKVVPGGYTLSLNNTTDCLTSNGRTGDSSRLSVSACNNQANQKWTVKTEGTGFSLIDSNGMCLTATDPFFDGGLVLATCNSRDSQILIWQ